MGDYVSAGGIKSKIGNERKDRKKDRRKTDENCGFFYSPKFLTQPRAHKTPSQTLKKSIGWHGCGLRLGRWCGRGHGSGRGRRLGRWCWHGSGRGEGRGRGFGGWISSSNKELRTSASDGF